MSDINREEMLDQELQEVFQEELRAAGVSEDFYNDGTMEELREILWNVNGDISMIDFLSYIQELKDRAGIEDPEEINILTAEGKRAYYAGEITEEDLKRMAKLEEVKKKSRIGRYESTFSACFDRIPKGLFDKLDPDDLAALADAFYQCYGDGKEEGRRER